MKTKLIFGALMLSALFLHAGSVLAYSPDLTHYPLSERSVDLYNNFYPDKPLSEQEKQWVAQGSYDEDRPSARVLFHFYDPLNNIGLPGYETSKEWAHNHSFQETFDVYTWEEAIAAYNRGDKEKAYKSLGHIFHLIQDATVPAHTRQDPHPEFDVGGVKISLYGGKDPYEKYAAEHKPPAITGMQPVVYSDINSYFDSVAKYTSTYFLSKDSLGAYNEPKLIRISGNYIYGRDQFGEYKLIKIQKPDSRFFNIQPVAPDKESLSDPLVLFDYWQRLSKTAIENNAGILKLFLDSVNNEAPQPLKLGFFEKIKNSITSTISKAFNKTKSAANYTERITSFFASQHEKEIQIVSDRSKSIISTGVPFSINIKNTKEQKEKEAQENFTKQLQSLLNTLTTFTATENSGLNPPANTGPALGNSTQNLNQASQQNVGQNQEQKTEPKDNNQNENKEIKFSDYKPGSSYTQISNDNNEEENNTDDVPEDNEEENEELDLEPEPESDPEPNSEPDPEELEEDEENSDEEPEQEQDTTVPSAIIDLIAQTGINIGEIILNWTAPGDDRNEGAADYYILKTAQDEITNENWETATEINTEIIQMQLAGFAHNFTLENFATGIVHFFAIKTVDEAGNTSELSNFVSAEAYSEPESEPDPVGGPPIWASFQNTGQNTGFSLFSGPEIEPELSWQKELEGLASTIKQPVIDNDGNIYLSANGTIYSFDKNGEDRWAYETDNIDTQGFALSSDSSRLYVSQKDFITLNTQDGSLINSVNILSGIINDTPTPPLVSEENDYVYVSTLENVYAFTKDGEIAWGKAWKDELWIDNISRIGYPLIYNDTLYIAAYITQNPKKYFLFAIDPDDGTVNWSRDLAQGGIWNPEGSPSVSSEGTMYIGYQRASNNHGIAAFDIENEAEFKWRLDFGNKKPFSLPPAIDSEGYIYSYPVDNQSSTFHRLEDNDTSAGIVFMFSTDNASKITTTTVVDSSDTLYIGTKDGIIYALDKTSTTAEPNVIWQYEIGEEILYLALGDGALYAITIEAIIYKLE